MFNTEVIVKDMKGSKEDMTDELLIVIIIQLFIVLWELRWMWKG